MSTAPDLVTVTRALWVARGRRDSREVSVVCTSGLELHYRMHGGMEVCVPTVQRYPRTPPPPHAIPNPNSNPNLLSSQTLSLPLLPPCSSLPHQVCFVTALPISTSNSPSHFLLLLLHQQQQPSNVTTQHKSSFFFFLSIKYLSSGLKTLGCNAITSNSSLLVFFLHLGS